MRISLLAVSTASLSLLLAIAPAAAAKRPPAGMPPQSSPPRPAGSAFVPGSGTAIEYVGDDFEAEGWGFEHRHPKSSREQDERTRSPMGVSLNDRWHEGPERGQPDQIEVVPTPEGGLPGSQYALLMRTLHSGVPGFNSNDVQQDDLIANSISRLQGGIPVAERPSCTVRVYLPPADQWERRSGPHFGFRASASTLTVTKTAGLFSMSRESEVEPYWPGMWIHFRSAGTRGVKEDSAYIAVRSNRMGHDFRAKDVNEFGWWTLGMSFSHDGMVHYYASPGVDDLTAEDYLTSQYPYGFQARQFRTYFFDVCNRNDGRTWSTPFIIDDPQLHLVDARRVTTIVQRREASAARLAERKAEAAANKSTAKSTTVRKTAGKNRRTR